MVQDCSARTNMLNFTGERIVPEADNCEPRFALKMYQEHIARYLFAAQVCTGKTVLDIGCGVGYGAQLLARSGAAAVTAFDLSDAAIFHAREHYSHPRLRFLVASAEDFAFATRFDVITCFELIEHVYHQHRAVERISAALADDGVLIVSTPRPVGNRRSAFHTRELAFSEFSDLLANYFSYVATFFENNHFASLIASGQPKALDAIYALHPQFNLGQADYFIAVASHAPLDVSRFRPQMVLNNDDYVCNLENDVNILHRIEDDLKTQVSALTETTSCLRTELENRLAAEAQLSAALSERESVPTTEQVLRAELERTQLRIGELEDGQRSAAEQARTIEQILRTELQVAHERATELEAWRSSLQQEATLWRQRATDHQIGIDSLRTQINALYQSASWRITSPLRKGLDVILAARRFIRRGRRANHAPPAPHSIISDDTADGGSESRGEFRGRTQFDVIYVIGCHEGESKRYRVFNLVEGLRDLGYAVDALSDAEIMDLIRSNVQIKTIILFRSGDTPQSRALLVWARERGVAVGFDIDDLVFEPESIDFVRIVSTFSQPERSEYMRGVEQYRRMLLSADFVTCPTDFLADRIERLGKRALVIPNSLNQRQIEISERMRQRNQSGRTGQVRIGYFSGSNTHQVDFQACESALISIMTRHSHCRFVLGGILDLGPQWDHLSDRIERLPFMAYDQLLEVFADIDINLAPLEVGNPYCEGKSQLKIFEAGIMGIPSVVSATASHRDAIEHGHDGFLAASEAEWTNVLEKLVMDEELRKRIGENAHKRSLAQFSVKVAAEAAEQAYGFAQSTPAKVDAARSTLTPAGGVLHPLRISWIIPSLIIGGGGHRNILRAAYYLHRFGHEIELYFTNTDLTEQQLAEEAVRKHFYPLDCPMYVYRGAIRRTDVLFATHWSTVDAAVRAKNVAGELMYFVQDFEPAFAPMGTEYILAENTYRLGLYHITSGPWCEHVLRLDYGCDADHFMFPVDRTVYYPRERARAERNILFFAKPEMPRRCFELGTMALQEFHRLRPDVEITLFGSRHVDRERLPFPATVRSLLPTIEDLATLYANADLGVVFSTTNPSLVPYEMMACGLPVVDLGRPGNEINYGRRTDIALLADPNPTIMAGQIRDLLEDPSEVTMRANRGLQFIKTFPSEEEMARRVESLILGRLAARGYEPERNGVGVRR